MKVTGIHHITLRSQNPVAARRFYEEVIGLEFMEIPVSGEVTSIWKGAPAEGVLLATQAGSTFLVIAPPLEGTAEGDRFSEYRIGLDHLGFAVEDRAELDSLVERLRAAGVATEGVETDVVLGKEYVAFRDPDNVQWEAYMV
ncbi:MAG TPA: VOC family protein [Actinomycetota bacterium]|nr:VOC family protein [Actinomycetota bacterium]